MLFKVIVSSGLLCVPCRSFTTQRYCVVCTVRDVMDMLCATLLCKSLRSTCSQYCLSVVSLPFGLFVLYKCDVFRRRGNFIVSFLFNFINGRFSQKSSTLWVKKKKKKTHSHPALPPHQCLDCQSVRFSCLFCISVTFFCCIFLCYCPDVNHVSSFVLGCFFFQSANNRTVRWYNFCKAKKTKKQKQAE